MKEAYLAASFEHSVSEALLATLNHSYIAERSEPKMPASRWWASLDLDKLLCDRSLYEAEKSVVSGLMLAYAQTLIPHRDAHVSFVHVSLSHEGLHWSGSAYFDRRPRQQSVTIVKPLVPEAA